LAWRPQSINQLPYRKPKIVRRNRDAKSARKAVNDFFGWKGTYIEYACIVRHEYGEFVIE